MNVPKETIIQKMHMMSLQDYRNSGGKLQYDETTTNNIVIGTLMVNTIV